MNTALKTVLASAIALSLPAIAAAQSCPSYDVSGAPLSYTAESAYIPQSTGVVAGGPLNLANCGSIPGNGYIVPNPDFTMQYDDLGMGRQLEFRVEAACDTVLLINASDGQWYFDDDTDASNPAIRLSVAPSGQYDIWVGTYDSTPCDAVLTVETF